MARKNVRFYFYYSHLNNKRENLKEFFDKIIKNYDAGYNNLKTDDDAREYLYTNVLESGPIRLADITKVKDYYFLTFDRFQHTIPKVSKMYGESIDLNIDEDEYISHEISVLYSPTQEAFMVQRNINSLNESSIEALLSKIYFEIYKVRSEINLAVVRDDNAKDSLVSAHSTRSLIIKTHGAKAENMLQALFRDAAPEDLDYIEVKISAQRAKDATLDRSILKNVVDNKDEYEKIQGKIIIDEGDNVTPVDYFEQKLVAYESFNLTSRQELNRFSVQERMENSFRDIYALKL
ncbi:DUF6731 family protein [Nosocomiicoccus sp. HMSC059G07]|uniref:DUF6731 family protein n=1 Tax=Nosocomiicoccus sp. HMSC059G07 TaxID=1739531 RepID=UPI0008A441EE|nr:DUF6731 family protein [Nosocomiicoccus sp. HMSC059G07]OFO55672.1 hypothetical protein HMPREF3029_03610 [Nosocomiicoccus sp. HMSC059G07]